MFVVVVRERERREKRERVNEEVPEPDLGIRQIGCITVFLPPVPRAITRFGTYSYVPFALFCACLFGKSHPTALALPKKCTTNTNQNLIRGVLISPELVPPRTMAASHISGHRQTPHLSPRKIHRRPRPLAAFHFTPRPTWRASHIRRGRHTRRARHTRRDLSHFTCLSCASLPTSSSLVAVFAALLVVFLVALPPALSTAVIACHAFTCPFAYVTPLLTRVWLVLTILFFPKLFMTSLWRPNSSAVRSQVSRLTSIC